MYQPTLTVALAAAICLSAHPAQEPTAPGPPRVAAVGKAPTRKAAQGSQLDLTPGTFAKLHTLVRPHEHEWRHLKVAWLTDVVAARKLAAAQDKPIVICYTGGAGYNEPLGIC